MKHDSEFMERINRDLMARKRASRILNVQRNASVEELKRAYREAAIEHHPDHNGNTPEANKRFALIKCAYELLAFDKPCEALLANTNFQSNVPEDNQYSLDNRWGHFCWWREKFFGQEPVSKAIHTCQSMYNKAKDTNGDCDCCRKGIEVQQDYEAAPLQMCPQCGRDIVKALSSFSIGLSKTGLDHRTQEKGFHKLKRLGEGEYERVY